MGSNYSGTISFDCLDLSLKCPISDNILCLTVDGELTIEGYSGDYDGPQDGAMPPSEEVTDAEVWLTDGYVPYVYNQYGEEHELSYEEYSKINDMGLCSWLEEYWGLDIHSDLPSDGEIDEASNDYEEDNYYDDDCYDVEDGMPSETTERIDYDPDC